MLRSAEEIPSNTTTTLQVAVAVGHKTDTNSDREKHLSSVQAGNTMRCWWVYVKQWLNRAHQCKLPGVGEDTTERNLILLSAHLPAVSKRISLSLSSRERWNRYAQMVLSGARNCSAFPKSAGLVGALGPPASSGALLSSNITRLERTLRGLLYRLHFSELLNVNSCKLQGWSSQGSTSPLRLFSSEEPLASWRLCQRQKWECEDM